MRHILKRTLAIGTALAMSCTVAGADNETSELLMRKTLAFHQCPQTISAILHSMNADGAHVQVTRDTGAHYRVKLAAAAANLIFNCNAVAQQIEITRQTPGDLISVSGG